MSPDIYQQAAAIAFSGKHEAAWKILAQLLIDNPNDGRALVTASYAMRCLGGLPQAYHFGKAATVALPLDPATWTNLGHACAQMWLIDEAERYYKRGLTCARNEADKKSLWLNMAALYIDCGKFDQALTFVNKILHVDPEHKNALTNLGFCKLALRDWSGWVGYHGTIGSDWRPKINYRGEPEWDGTPGKNVVLYADQGIGDEISFASMIPDAALMCRKLIIDCDGRLEHLFRRSFPMATVYGTRVKDHKWAKEDRDIEASLPLGQIGEFFRTTDDSFPGTAYLKPCPARFAQWKYMFKRPTVGIAWTGGVPKSNQRNRRLALKDLLPIFELDADFVSLQYKDASKEIADFIDLNPSVNLKQYSWATLTNDYDDTAALIAACDYVICIQTAVAHTAGALGVPVTVLLPTATTWRYGLKSDSIPWYKSLNIIRQERDGSWKREIERARDKIAAHLSLIPKDAAGVAREGQLRNGLNRVRPGGLQCH